MCHIRCRGGAGGGLNEIPTTFGSSTVLTGDGGGVGRRRGVADKQFRRSLRLTTRSTRVWSVGGVYGTVNLVISAAGSHLLLYGAGRQGAHQSSGLDAPNQGAFVRARPDSDPLGSGSAGDQANSLPLDLTLYFLFSLHLPFSRFIIDLCIKHASSSRSKVDRLNSYNTRIHSETDSLILLSPFSPEITDCPLNPCRLRVP
jgi:hypothetical protein